MWNVYFGQGNRIKILVSFVLLNTSNGNSTLLLFRP